MKYLTPSMQGMTEASMLDSHSLIIAVAILVVVGIMVVTLSVLFRPRSVASGTEESMGPGRIVLKIIILAAVAASLACYFLLDGGKLQGVVGFIAGKPCCAQDESQACCSSAKTEQNKQSLSEAVSPGRDAMQAGQAGEAEE